MVSGRFAPVSQLTLKTIAGYNESKKVNMMFAGAFINAESAKLGYLLSKLAGEGRHYSFFGNSAQEAVAGAVKLARHNSVRAKRDDGGWILFVDGSGYFKPYLDPLGAGEEKAIAPHLAFVSSLEEALNRVDEQKWAAVLLVRTQETERDPETCKRLLDKADKQGALRIVCSSEIEPSRERLFASELPAEVHVLGENLTDREVPFGCFVMSSKAYSVWNNPTDSLAHTSTFGGNGICLAIALDVLRRAGLVTDEDEQLFSRIDEDPDARSRYFRRHVNPGAADGMRTFGFDLDIDKADGGRLTLTDGRVLLDCCGGTGASLRGHNPPDLVPEVLDTHEEHRDYFADLEGLISGVSRFPHALPAVSGATAVEIALGMALLANPTRTKVITFKGNYSGKSLVSLNLSKYGPTAASTDRDAFRPYYFDLVYVDPFQPGAATQLAELLRADDVAVVWFEYIQGMLCLPLPDDVIQVVNELKQEHGYLIGVDEVLSGAWRGGEHFLAHHDVVPECDISTLAKPLSDMTLPMAATLVTAEVLARAKDTDTDHVERLQHHYRNGIAAHIAFHALTWALDPARQDRRVLQQKRLRAALDELASESRLFESVAGLGAHIRLVPKRRWFPFKSRSTFNQMLKCSMQNLFLTRTGVLLGQQRFFHGIFADDEDVEATIVRLRVLSGVHPLAIYWNVVTCVYKAFKVSKAKEAEAETMNTASAVIEAPPPELTRRIPLPPTTEALKFPVIWNMSPLLDDPQYDHVAFSYAFEKTVGRAPSLVPRRRSRTDPAVSLDMLVRNGVPEQKARHLLGVFLPCLSFPASEGQRFCLDERSVASFREAIAGLDVCQTVICPEVRPVALAKLAAAQLIGHIDVGFAAFGSDHIDLDALPEVVRSRTRARKDRT